MDRPSSSDMEKDAIPHGLDKEQLDVGAQLAAGSDASNLSSEEALRIRKKIDGHIMPLMCLMYMMAFADKISLGQSAVLGIIPGARLTQDQFNWLGTIFYIAYLTFSYPQALALQRFPVGKWMSVNIFIWAVALLCHAASKSFGALMAVRFILGMCEGAITPGFMIITSMFYTREEQTRRVGYWFLFNGFAIILLGLLSFGLVHIKTPTFAPWQWLMIITGAITLFTSVVFWFLFPDSPTTAWFLTPEERISAVLRIQVNQTGVENKHFKREQMIEALKDPKVWAMAFFAAVSQILNSLTNQRQLIIRQFGFSLLHTTLLGCVDGVMEIFTIWVAVFLAGHWKNGRAYAAAGMFVPAIIGTILVNTLPSGNKVGLLFSYWVSIFAIAPYVIFLGWIGSVMSGHTKRITVNAIVMSAYAIGNAAGPFMWKKTYQPRNHVPWTILSVTCGVCLLTLLALRYIYVLENKKRDLAPVVESTYDEVYIEVLGKDGKTSERKVDKAYLDLTDKQNQSFRYVL